jgi:thioredoxin-related protein
MRHFIWLHTVRIGGETSARSGAGRIGNSSSHQADLPDGSRTSPTGKPALILLSILALVVCLGVPGCKSSTPTPDKWAEHTQGLPFIVGYDEGRAAAAAQGKPAMMFITTTWCGWCKKLANESFNDPEIRNLLANFVCVIVDGDTESDAMRKLGAGGGFPQIVFVSPGGEILGGCLGYVPAEKFKSVTEEALRQSRAPKQDKA